MCQDSSLNDYLSVCLYLTTFTMQLNVSTLRYFPTSCVTQMSISVISTHTLLLLLPFFQLITWIIF